MQRVGATGQGQGRGGACVLVLGEHVAVRVGQCTGQQRGCGVLHVPLMSFLGQARPWGELISKQAREEPLQPSAAAAGSLTDHSFCFCFSPALYCFLFLCLYCCKLSLLLTEQFSLSASFFSISFSLL